MRDLIQLAAAASAARTFVYDSWKEAQAELAKAKARTAEAGRRLERARQSRQSGFYVDVAGAEQWESAAREHEEESARTFAQLSAQLEAVGVDANAAQILAGDLLRAAGVNERLEPVLHQGVAHVVATRRPGDLELAEVLR